jgi:hypothetical protein
MREGVKPVYAVRVHEHRVENGELVLTCVDRADPKWNLNNYAIVIRLSAPMADAVRVQVTHALGRKSGLPVFPLDYRTTTKAEITAGDTLSFKSGELEVVINQRPFSMKFLRNAELVCESRPNSLGVMTVARERDYVIGATS